MMRILILLGLVGGGAYLWSQQKKAAATPVQKIDKKLTVFMTVAGDRVLVKDPAEEIPFDMPLADVVKDVEMFSKSYAEVEVALFLDNPNDKFLSSLYESLTRFPNVSVYAEAG